MPKARRRGVIIFILKIDRVSTYGLKFMLLNKQLIMLVLHMRIGFGARELMTLEFSKCAKITQLA